MQPTTVYYIDDHGQIQGILVSNEHAKRTAIRRAEERGDVVIGTSYDLSDAH